MPTAIAEPAKLLLNLREACEALSVSESTMRRLPIPFVKTTPSGSARRLYAVADLQAWIDANRHTA